MYVYLLTTAMWITEFTNVFQQLNIFIPLKKKTQYGRREKNILKITFFLYFEQVLACHVTKRLTYRVTEYSQELLMDWLISVIRVWGNYTFISRWRKVDGSHRLEIKRLLQGWWSVSSGNSACLARVRPWVETLVPQKKGKKKNLITAGKQNQNRLQSIVVTDQ
jgi:hypothetical protein